MTDETTDTGARSTDIAALPDGYVTRPPSVEDAELVFRLIGDCEALELGEVQLDLADVRADWRRPGVDVPADGIFVLDHANEAVAYGEVFAARAEGNVVPSHRGRGIGTFLASWIEARAREVGDRFVRQVVPANAQDRLELLATDPAARRARRSPGARHRHDAARGVLRALGTAGRTRLGLSTDSRTGALGLYQRVGMQVVREYAGMVRALD